LATSNKNFKVKKGLEVNGPIGVGSAPDYGTAGQLLVSSGTDTPPTWEDPSAGGGGISNVVEDSTPQLGGDLDTNGYDITNLNALTLDTTPSGVPGSQGTFAWNPDQETLDIQLDTNVVLPVGQKHVIRVKNSSGSVAIPKGTVVSFAGATGDTVTVTPSISTSAYEPYTLVGVTSEEIPADGFGFVTQFGFVNNVDTDGMTLGSLLYVDPATPGLLTTTQPAAPNWTFPIAAVTKVNASSGRILVRIIPGGHLHDIVDVAITSPGDNELLSYESSTGTWINKTAEEAGVASLSGATFTGEVEVTSGNQFTGSGAGLNTVPAMVTDDTKPSSPVDGQVWFNASTGKTYVYYVDADSGQWVEIFGAKDVQDLKIRTENIEQNVFNRNYIINGGFDIWQRGTGFTALGTGAYGPDRWAAGVSPTNMTQSTDTPIGSGFSVIYERTSGTVAQIMQRIEANDAKFLANKTVTLSWWQKEGGLDSSTQQVAFYFPNTTDVFSSVTQIGSTTTVGSLSTSWQRFTITITLPQEVDQGLQVLFNTAGINKDIYLWGVQLEEGSVATPFRRQGENIQAEIAACQRYYEIDFLPIAAGFADGTTTARVAYSYQRKRIPPTLSFAGGEDTVRIAMVGVDPQVASTSMAQGGQTSETISSITLTTTGLTSGQGLYMYIGVPGSTKYIEINAEL
jgi:hypothetical protein